MNAEDEDNAKASSEERKRNRKSKKTAKTLAIPEEQLNDEEKEDIVESSSEETGRKTDKSKIKKSAAKRKRSSKHAKQDEMSSDEDKPKDPKVNLAERRVKKGKKEGKQGNECQYSENDIIDETETGADILKLLLHPCKLPFEVQNKLLFYLDDDKINILAKDRIKSKEGYEAGPTFNFHDHAHEPIKNLLRVPPGQNSMSNMNKIYDVAEKAYMVEIGKAGDSTDSNAYIKDDRGLIHKFKLNMKTCVETLQIVMHISKMIEV